MDLMRIDVNATTNQCEWKNIVEGDGLQEKSLPISHVGQGSPLLVVSQDGSTLAHLSQLVDGPGDFWMLQCWDTTTGFLTCSSTLKIYCKGRERVCKRELKLVSRARDVLLKYISCPSRIYYELLNISTLAA